MNPGLHAPCAGFAEAQAIGEGAGLRGGGEDERVRDMLLRRLSTREISWFKESDGPASSTARGARLREGVETEKG